MTVQAGSSPANVDLVVFRGDDFIVNFILYNPDGTAVDLSDFVAEAQIRPSTSSTVVTSDFTCSIEDNIVTISLTSVDTTDLVRNAAWDVQISSGDGLVTTLAYGLVQVKKDITHS